MKIRRATSADAVAIAAAEEEIFTDPWSMRDILSYICSEGGMCYVATSDGGDILSYVIGRVIAPEGEIYRIATRPTARRRGVAYRLLDYAMKTEKGRGLECTFLEVRESNTAARNLYHSYGFRDMGRRKNYYSLPVEDAIVMVRAHSADFGEKY